MPPRVVRPIRSVPALATKDIAGASAFVAGGVGTIVAAIGSFGSDDSALAAARRNHVWWLVAAASFAALGLMLGGLYALAKGVSPKPRVAPNKKIKRLLRWAHLNAGRLVLGGGVVAVALGVGLGAYATTNRQPGRPTISVARINPGSVQVEITADGLPSADWYEAWVRGYTDSSVITDGVFLAGAQFSPGQDGKLDWKAEVQVPPDRDGKPVTRVIVTVGHNNAPPDATSCNLSKDERVTCLAIRVPSAEPAR
jgi:hypothetical protein